MAEAMPATRTRGRQASGAWTVTRRAEPGVAGEDAGDQVEPHPRGQPVQGREPQHRAGHRPARGQDAVPGLGLGPRVQRQGPQRGLLVARHVAVPVDAAGAGEHEAGRARLAGGAVQRRRGGDVHLAGQSRPRGARRVADDSGQVHDRVRAGHGPARGERVADIAAQQREPPRRAGAQERGTAEREAVQRAHRVAGGQQPGDDRDADVPGGPGYQDEHDDLQGKQEEFFLLPGQSARRPAARPEGIA